MQNLINELSKSEFIYDPKLYIFNPISFNKTNKNIEKKEIKILQSQETKVLSKQIIYLDIFELSMISSFLIWTSDTNSDKEIA